MMEIKKKKPGGGLEEVGKQWTIEENTKRPCGTAL